MKSALTEQVNVIIATAFLASATLAGCFFIIQASSEAEIEFQVMQLEQRIAHIEQQIDLEDQTMSQ